MGCFYTTLLCLLSSFSVTLAQETVSIPSLFSPLDTASVTAVQIPLQTSLITDSASASATGSDFIISLPCTKDALYTSLSQDGLSFCSEMVEAPCESITTPSAWVTHGEEQLSSYCECVLTEYESTARPTISPANGTAVVPAPMSGQASETASYTVENPETVGSGAATPGLSSSGTYVTSLANESTTPTMTGAELSETASQSSKGTLTSVTGNATGSSEPGTSSSGTQVPSLSGTYNVTGSGLSTPSVTLNGSVFSNASRTATGTVIPGSAMSASGTNRGGSNGPWWPSQETGHDSGSLPAGGQAPGGANATGAGHSADSTASSTGSSYSWNSTASATANTGSAMSRQSASGSTYTLSQSNANASVTSSSLSGSVSSGVSFSINGTRTIWSSSMLVNATGSGGGSNGTAFTQRTSGSTNQTVQASWSGNTTRTIPASSTGTGESLSLSVANGTTNSAYWPMETGISTQWYSGTPVHTFSGTWSGNSTDSRSLGTAGSPGTSISGGASGHGGGSALPHASSVGTGTSAWSRGSLSDSRDSSTAQWSIAITLPSTTVWVQSVPGLTWSGNRTWTSVNGTFAGSAFSQPRISDARTTNAGSGGNNTVGRPSQSHAYNGTMTGSNGIPAPAISTWGSIPPAGYSWGSGHASGYSRANSTGTGIYPWTRTDSSHSAGQTGASAGSGNDTTVFGSGFPGVSTSATAYRTFTTNGTVRSEPYYPSPTRRFTASVMTTVSFQTVRTLTSNGSDIVVTTKGMRTLSQNETASLPGTAALSGSDSMAGTQLITTNGSVITLKPAATSMSIHTTITSGGTGGAGGVWASTVTTNGTVLTLRPSGHTSITRDGTVIIVPESVGLPGHTEGYPGSQASGQSVPGPSASGQSTPGQASAGSGNNQASLTTTGEATDATGTGAAGTAATSAVTTRASWSQDSGAGGQNMTRSGLTNSTTIPAHTISAANFTSVTRSAYLTQASCLHLPSDPNRSPTHRAVLRNAKLREANATIPYPYVESVDFDNEGVDPLWMTLRDVYGGTHYLDISNRSQIALLDTDGDSVTLDKEGIHFASGNCTYGLSFTIKDMYAQLAKLSDQPCSSGSTLGKRLDDMQFNQTLWLKDQCDHPVGRDVRPYPRLRVGDTECADTAVDEDTGRWDFDCTFPGDESETLRCQFAVQNNVLDFLFTDPFGGSCPDLSTAVTALNRSSHDFMNNASFHAEIDAQNLEPIQREEADEIVSRYGSLWTALIDTLARNQTSGSMSPLLEYVNVYNHYRNFDSDICEDLHLGEIPLKLSLDAGATHLSPITTLNWAPEMSRSYNITIQDPSQVACCSAGSVAAKSSSNGTCAYPGEAVISDTNCLCGKTAGGESIAFEYTECGNFVATCTRDGDCAAAGHSGFVCLTGSCCDGGVCVDPYACAQNGTVLVKFDDEDA